MAKENIVTVEQSGEQLVGKLFDKSVLSAKRPLKTEQPPSAQMIAPPAVDYIPVAGDL